MARSIFIGLLPEVAKRCLYKRGGFHSIYHFAAVLGGVSQRLVDEALRLEKRFEDMPTLHLALVKGEIGLSKLARVASVVEVKNEAEICKKIRTMSRRAIDVFVHDMRKNNKDENMKDGLFGLLGDVDSDEKRHCEPAELSQGASRGNPSSSTQEQSRLPRQTASLLSVTTTSGQNFDYEILLKLTPEVKAKIKELIDKEIDVNAILMQAFSKREDEIEHQKNEIGSAPAKSRRLPSKIKRLVKAEYGTKCSHESCKKRAEQIHHDKLYALHHDHDPHYLKPLCKGHHELLHLNT